MKKEFIMIIALVVIIVIADIIFTKITDNKINDIIQRLDTINGKIISEDKTAKENIIELKETWKGHSDELEFYIEHEDIEKISIEMESLYCYYNSKNKDETFSSIARLKAMVGYITDKHRFKLNNFF